MNDCLSKYHRWSVERFPLPAVLLYSGAQFYLAYYFGGLLPEAGAPVFRETIIGWTILFLMLLRLRVTDEQKDFVNDTRAYPDRMLSRGIITMRHLHRLFWGALLVEVALCMILGLPMLYLWVGSNIWFLLMVFEFFAPTFLNAHIGWYLITHQLLVPVYAMFPIVMRLTTYRLPPSSWVWLAVFLTALMCGTMTYEMARKTWSPDREHPDAVSYSRDWGMPAAILVTQIFAWTSSALLILLMINYDAPLWPAMPMIAVNTAFLAVELRFRRKPTRASSKRVEYYGAAAMLVSFLCATLAFALAKFNISGPL